MLLFSSQALSDFKAEDAKVASEVKVAFFFIIHSHVNKKGYTNSFFFFFKQNL